MSSSATRRASTRDTAAPEDAAFSLALAGGSPEAAEEAAAFSLVLPGRVLPLAEAVDDLPRPSSFSVFALVVNVRAGVEVRLADILGGESLKGESSQPLCFRPGPPGDGAANLAASSAAARRLAVASFTFAGVPARTGPGTAKSSTFSTGKATKPSSESDSESFTSSSSSSRSSSSSWSSKAPCMTEDPTDIGEAGEAWSLLTTSGGGAWTRLMVPDSLWRLLERWLLSQGVRERRRARSPGSPYRSRSGCLLLVLACRSMSAGTDRFWRGDVTPWSPYSLLGLVCLRRVGSGEGPVSAGLAMSCTLRAGSASSSRKSSSVSSFAFQSLDQDWLDFDQDASLDVDQASSLLPVQLLLSVLEAHLSPVQLLLSVLEAHLSPFRLFDELADQSLDEPVDQSCDFQASPS